MPARIPHADIARAPVDMPALQQDVPAPPRAAARRTRRMSDVLEDGPTPQRRRLLAEEHVRALAPVALAPDVDGPLVQVLGAIAARPAAAADVLELRSICGLYGTARVLRLLLVPSRAHLAMLLLPTLPPGPYGALTLTLSPLGARYLGHYDKGQACGFGIVRRGDGCEFIGHFVDGQLSGSVVAYKPDGSLRRGLMDNGVWQGIVTERLPDGVTRYGHMLKGQFIGTVHEYDTQGNATWGLKQNGMFEGPVTRFDKSGSRITCIMVHGVMQGAYRRQFYGGHLEGTMVDGLLEGQARQFGPGAQYITGQVVAGHFTGLIERRFADGHVYRGDAVDGLPHGEGVKTFYQGGQYAGRFERGEMAGQGTMTYPNGDAITGLWRQGRCTGNYQYQTSKGVKMGYQLFAARAYVSEIRPQSAKPVRDDGMSSRQGDALLEDKQWHAMLAHHDIQTSKRVGARRKTELLDPWRDWQPNTPAIHAIAGMFDHVASARFETHPATHQFLLGLMHLLGPAHRYQLFVEGAFQIEFNVFGHYANQATFVAETMPLNTASVLEIVLRKQDAQNNPVSVLFHQENYAHARAMFVSSFEYMVAGLTQAWQYDVKHADAHYTASNAILTHLLDNGPCMEARTTAMTQTLLGLELVEDVARDIPDLEGKDLFAQSNEMLRLFRAQAIERFAHLYQLDPRDSLAIEADAHFTKSFFNTTFFRRFLTSFASFKDVSEADMQAVIRYQLDVIGVLDT